MTRIATLDDCNGSCHRGGCECGAIVNDVLQVGRSVRVPMMLRDSAAKGTAMPTPVIDERTGFVDQAFIDAEASKPEYDWCRHMISRSGFSSLAHEYAMRNLLAASPAGQRAEAAYDHHVHKLSTAHAEHTGTAAQTQTPAPQFAKDGRPLASLTDAECAREIMIAQMGQAWQRGVDDINAWRK